MTFRPEVDHTLTIDDVTYRFTEHPAAPGMPYGQTGRRATVYQVQANNAFHALKVFTPAFRSRRVAEGAVRLRPFATLPGLQVCARTVLTPEAHTALLSAESDLAYAVLMPWIAGETWQELLLGRQPFKPEQSLKLARTLADILATMEQQRLAHCDLSGPNLIIKLATLTVTLVDVEEIYAPGLTRPEKLPGGSEGYAHKSAPQGLWSAEADRFAGAVLLAEILGWCDENIRQIAHSEQYFDPAEMQQNGERYQRLLTVLRERWGSALANAFARTWYSETLADCPTLATWAQHLAALPGAATGAVSADVMPVSKGHGPSPTERLARGKVEAAEAWLELDEADKALAELEEALRLAPEIAAPVYARAYLKRGTQKEQAGDLTGALADYRMALTHAPTEGLQDELRAIISEVEAKLAPPEPPAQPVTPHCPHCEREVQVEWIRCPYCGEPLRGETVEVARPEVSEVPQEEVVLQDAVAAPPQIRTESKPKRRIPGWVIAVVAVVTLVFAGLVIAALCGAFTPYPVPMVTTVSIAPTSVEPMTTPMPAEYALQFDGTDDFVSIANNGDFDFDNSFSVEAWIKPLSIGPSSAKSIIQGAFSEPPFTGGGWVVFLDQGTWGLSVCVPECNAAETDGNLQIDRWQHIAATYDGTNISVYRNGEMVSQTAWSGDVTDINFIILGRWDTSFHGVIDEVRVWDIAITQAQILENMNKTLNSAEPGLVGYWQLNEGNGQIVFDNIGHHDGQLGSSSNSDDNDPEWVTSDVPVR